MERIDAKYALGIFFILISIIGVICSVCIKKNYILDIVRYGTIGILLISISEKIKYGQGEKLWNLIQIALTCIDC